MPRLLVVDDDRLIADKTAKFFRATNWDVVTAYDVDGAMKAISAEADVGRKKEFDAVLLDLRLPEKEHEPALDDGGERIFVEIRKRRELNATCVILLTAYGTIESAVRCLRAGAYHYIEKEVELEDLRRLLVAGIAKQKADALRAEILGNLDLDSLLSKIGRILSETLAPDGAYLVSLDSTGTIRDVRSGLSSLTEAEVRFLRTGMPRTFIEQIRSTRQPILISGRNQTRLLGAILPDSQSLLAVPIVSGNREVRGIIDLESFAENAFDPSWEGVVAYFADLIAFATDMTEKAEARLNAELAVERATMNSELLAQKSAVHQMTLTVKELGHRILTPVQVISMQAETMAAKDLRVAPTKAKSDNLLRSARRRAKVIMDKTTEIGQVCDYLRDISRDVPVRHEDVNLWSVIRETVGVHSAQLEREKIAITLPGREIKKLAVKADSSLLRYSFECLLQNAVEAIQEARLLRKRKAATDQKKESRKEDSITISVELDTPRSRVLAKIADTGTGVSEEHRDRLFVALFTTKKKSNGKHLSSGTGTGLFSVSRYMRLQGGSVELADTPIPGATFILSIPLSDAIIDGAPEGVNLGN